MNNLFMHFWISYNTVFFNLFTTSFKLWFNKGYYFSTLFN